MSEDNTDSLLAIYQKKKNEKPNNPADKTMFYQRLFQIIDWKFWWYSTSKLRYVFTCHKKNYQVPLNSLVAQSNKGSFFKPKVGKKYRKMSAN